MKIVGLIIYISRASGFCGLFIVAGESKEKSHSSLSEEKEGYSADGITSCTSG